ncbi:MAG: hypothetical protein A2V64_09065 [Bacteroidetes bacterium RBG_13_43_22]|nr:MAG: hypothetical protein A2V64_09065 [Bacteroidetes bacterium RBG_13_43_22]OFY73349.1 MAG: hypothetical protein A2V46_03285 [Bacteroidetes bacterium RBG_19FT_COMBO_42_7]
MKNWIYFIIAWILYMVIHEGVHAFAALQYGEYDSILIHWYGPQVIYVTPVAERIPDIKWFAISGASNLATLLTGYILYSLRKRIGRVKSVPLRSILYYTTIVLLLFDAINLSLGPFLYGGDINGISTGLAIKPWIIQILFGCILLVNRELIVKFMESFNIRSVNVLFKSWYNKL